MKKHIIYAVVALLSLGACSQNDMDEVRDEQKNQATRMDAIEAWRADITTQINSLQTLLDAINAEDRVKSYTGDATNGYVLTLVSGKTITLKNGVNGNTPVIGVTKKTDDNKYYWTVKIGDADPVIMTNPHDNNKECVATGDAPKVRINAETNEWEYSMDGGENWISTKTKATGATLIQSVNINKEEGYVEVLLTGMETPVKIECDQLSLLLVPFAQKNGTERTVNVKVNRDNMTKADFNGLLATISFQGNTYTSMSSSAGDPFVLTISPVYNEEGFLTNFSLNVKVNILYSNAESASGTFGFLTVSMIDTKGKLVESTVPVNVYQMD